MSSSNRAPSVSASDFAKLGTNCGGNVRVTLGRHYAESTKAARVHALAKSI